MRKFVLSICIAVSLCILFNNTVTADDYFVITVNSGDTVNSIADRYLRSRTYIYDLLYYNNMSSPSEIQVGQQLYIPYSLTEQRIARVIYSQGDVQFMKSDGSDWMTMRVGQIVEENDALWAGDNSHAILELDDGSRIRVSENSTITLNDYHYSGDYRNSNIEVNSGSIFARVNSLTAGNQFRFNSSSAVAGVRGTNLHINFDPQSNITTIVVKEGQVKVWGKNQSIESGVVLNSGFATEVGPDGKPKTPYQFDLQIFTDWID